MPYGETRRMRRETCPIIPRLYTTGMSYANTLKTTQKETTAVECTVPIKGKGAPTTTNTQEKKEHEIREYITQLAKKSYNSYTEKNIKAKEMHNNTEIEIKNLGYNKEDTSDQEYSDKETKCLNETKDINPRLKKARREGKEFSRLGEDETFLK